jgi:predicted transcriptional regulator
VIKSLSLTYDQVARILEEHINAAILRTPQRVTAVDPWDWDGADQHQFTISLAPFEIEEHAPDPATERLISAVLNAPPTPTNGNGHHPVTAVTPAAARPSRGPAARIPDAQRVEILRLFDAGLPQTDIADKLGIAQSTASRIISEHRGPGAASARKAEEQARRRIALEPADEANIIRLAEDGLAIADIADQLELDRKAVVNYLAGRNADPEPTPAPVEPQISQEATQAPPAEGKKRRGGVPKLTADQRFTIVRVRTEYGTPVRDLAARYGVSEATIYDVIAEARHATRELGQPGQEAQAGDA